MSTEGTNTIKPIIDCELSSLSSPHTPKYTSVVLIFPFQFHKKNCWFQSIFQSVRQHRQFSFSLCSIDYHLHGVLHCIPLEFILIFIQIGELIHSVRKRFFYTHTAYGIRHIMLTSRVSLWLCVHKCAL